MSWAIVKRSINDNIQKPLNQQIKDYNLMPMWLFTGSTIWTPPKKGEYRIICIGKGADSLDGSYHTGGAAGGVVIAILKLSVQAYTLTIGTDALFSNIMGAYGGQPRTSSNQKSTAGGGFGGILYQSSDIPAGTITGGDTAIYMLGMRSEGGNRYDDNIGGGGGGFGGGGGSYNGSFKGKGGAGFAGGNGAAFFLNGTTPIPVAPGLGGGAAPGKGGAAAIIIEFISEIV